MTSKASKKPPKKQAPPQPPQPKENKTKLLKDCVDLLDRIFWKYFGTYLPRINVFLAVFQLNDQDFNWKVDNRTIWVLGKYLKSEVENGGWVIELLATRLHSV